MTEGSLFLNGAWSEGAGDGFASFDPATEARVWRGNAASGAQVAAAVEAARAAFPGWADRSRDERIAAMKRYQAVLKARRQRGRKRLSA